MADKYKTYRTKGGFEFDLPEGVNPLDADVKAWVQTQERTAREKTPEFQAKVEKQRAEDEKKYAPTSEKPILENIGAGIDTAWQGFKQIMPGMKGMSDEQLQEKRAIDKGLAAKTDMGIGADWMPTAGSALQFAGEVLPTTVIPGGAGAGIASKVLPKTLMGLKYARPAVGGMVGGGAAGAMMPVTSDESRLMNTALGAAGGAVLPAAMQAGRAAKTVFASPEKRAGRALTKALGDTAGDVAARAEAPSAAQTAAGRAIPETLAAKTGSAAAAQLESQAGRAGATRDAWADFVNEQNAARWSAIEKGTQEADTILNREAARESATTPMRGRALSKANRDPWFNQGVGDEARRIIEGPTGTNPAARRVADFVLSQMDERAERAITPERLYELRKVLADKLSGPHMIGDEMSAAVKGADRETKALMEAIDAALDRASGGQWKPYLQTYSRASRPVEAATAARDVRQAFMGEQVPSIGGVPEVTRHRLGRALEAQKQGRFNMGKTSLSPSAEGVLADVQGNLKRADEVQRARKLAGTAGGGSQTSTDLEDVLMSLAGGEGLTGRLIRRVAGDLTDAGRAELAQMLQNPQQAAAAIRLAQQRALPLSQAQEAVLRLTSGGAGASTLPLLQAQPTAQ